MYFVMKDEIRQLPLVPAKIIFPFCDTATAGMLEPAVVHAPLATFVPLEVSTSHLPLEVGEVPPTNIIFPFGRSEAASTLPVVISVNVPLATLAPSDVMISQFPPEPDNITSPFCRSVTERI